MPQTHMTVDQSRLGKAPESQLRVGFVLAPRFTMTAFAGFVDALRLAGDEGDRSRQVNCSWRVLGYENHKIESSCGIPVEPNDHMEDPTRFDYIVVVGGLLHGGQHVAPGTYTFLKGAARANVPLIGLCTGSFMLARAGLLEGYETCVSWFHREEFANAFPHLRVESNRMFVIDRDRLTCAGGTSVVHLAAHLVERHLGRANAIKSLRIMIEEAPLPAGAWQPEAIVTRQARDPLVRLAMLTIERDLCEPKTLPELLQPLDIGKRQIERRFIADIGISPQEYRQGLRLARAKWLLEHSDQTVTDIALQCGYSDCSHLTKSFRLKYDTTPSSVRRAAKQPKD